MLLVFLVSGINFSKSTSGNLFASFNTVVGLRIHLLSRLRSPETFEFFV